MKGKTSETLIQSTYLVTDLVRLKFEQLLRDVRVCTCSRLDRLALGCALASHPLYVRFKLYIWPTFLISLY